MTTSINFRAIAELVRNTIINGQSTRFAEGGLALKVQNYFEPGSWQRAMLADPAAGMAVSVIENILRSLANNDVEAHSLMMAISPQSPPTQSQVVFGPVTANDNSNIVQAGHIETLNLGNSRQAKREPLPKPQIKKISANIFISYRENASAAFARFLASELRNYTNGKVFYAKDSIRPGAFKERLTEEVTKCDVLLLLVSQGTFRGENVKQSPDWVDFEVSLAQSLNKTIVPILEEETQIPSISMLPEPIQKAFKNTAKRVHYGEALFKSDIQELITFIDQR
jgi:hypothetical protein